MGRFPREVPPSCQSRGEKNVKQCYLFSCFIALIISVLMMVITGGRGRGTFCTCPGPPGTCPACEAAWTRAKAAATSSSSSPRCRNMTRRRRDDEGTVAVVPEKKKTFFCCCCCC